MDNTGKSLLEGMERLGLMASHIRKNEGLMAQIEIDIILGELRSLYVAALQLEASEKGEASGMEDGASSAADSIAKKAAEEKVKKLYEPYTTPGAPALYWTVKPQSKTMAIDAEFVDAKR